MAASYFLSSVLFTHQQTTHFQFEWNGLSVCASGMLTSSKKDLRSEDCKKRARARKQQASSKRARARKPLSDSPLLPRTHAWRSGRRPREEENAACPHSPMLVDDAWEEEARLAPYLKPRHAYTYAALAV